MLVPQDVALGVGRVLKHLFHLVSFLSWRRTRHVRLVSSFLLLFKSSGFFLFMDLAVALFDGSSGLAECALCFECIVA